MIGIDWGTSSFRAYRLDASGHVIDLRSSAAGILSVQPGSFPQILEAQIGDWNERPIVMSGMVGSRQGWQEAPYVECPAGFGEVARGLKEVAPGVWIVPGVICREGVPDVMRGEETQLLGCGIAEGAVCLPGTHSKWAVMQRGKIARFTTHMTGEVFAVLKDHSILGRMMETGSSLHSCFLEGVERSGQAGGLLHHLFGVRTRSLTGELADPASYLSGILIGHELRAAQARQFYLLGTESLAQLYRQAADALGMRAHILDPQAAVRALFELGKLV